jgi:hypothetical protein
LAPTIAQFTGPAGGDRSAKLNPVHRGDGRVASRVVDPRGTG